MRARTQVTILEICVAFLCAVGAGFTGDLIAHFSHHSQAARHTRGTHPRGLRSVSRQSQEDHAIEIDVAHSDDSSVAVSGSAGHDTVAVIAPPGPPGAFFSWIATFRGLVAPSSRSPQLEVLRSRAPPASI
jgi:hypothetical protein